MADTLAGWLQRLLAAVSRPQHPDSASPAPHPHAKAYAAARKEIGTKEIPGPKHNPEVVGWFGQVGHSWVTDDETAWCAAFVGAMLQLGGLPSTRKLNARSYLDWGKPVVLEDAQEGDVVVFSRGSSSWQGHVGFFVEHSGARIMVLGGNQKNAVNVMSYPVSRLLGVRRHT